MNVMSLFDGISCGNIALERAGHKVKKYYASEIDKDAKMVAHHNYPNIIDVGNVWQLDGSLYKGIDLLIGGSPCQAFSFSGKQLNFQDPRGKLFFEYERILKEIKPTYFLLENVPMKQQYEDVISNSLGVKPITINSSLLSAQNRKRLYWTNIPNVTQPQDKGINLIDILADRTFYNKAMIVGRRLNDQGKREDYNKDIPLTQCLEVRAKNRNKSACLTTISKDNVLTDLPIGRYPDAYKNKLNFRKFSRVELCRLQTIPENYFDGLDLSLSKIEKMIGNAWTVDVIAHIFRSINVQ